MVEFAATIFRDFVTDGVPSSGAHKPQKPEVRAWGTWVENLIQSALTGGTGVLFQSKALLDANLNYPALTMVWVMNDPVSPSNNGIYQKQGASGSGSWVRVADLPYSVVYAQNAGAGTANAVVATSSVPVSTSAYSQLISVPFTSSNTGAMTLAINGETPRALVTNTGAAIPSGYVSAGMSALVQIDSDGNYRLFSYGDASAIPAVIEGLLVSATAEADRAEAARDAALTAISAGIPTVFPQMYGLVDDATLAVDQSANLQAMFDAIPAGATVDFGSLRIAFSTEVVISKSVRFTGRGYRLHGVGVMLTVAGTRTEVTYISAAASAGARQFTVASGSGILPNATLILQNTNSGSFYESPVDSRDYTDGEFIDVESVAGNVVTTKTLLKTDYSGGAAFKVFTVDLVDFSASGGDITGDGLFVLNLVHCTGLDITSNVTGGTDRAIYFNQCYKGYIPPCGRFVTTAPSSAAAYGMSFANSQDILVDNVFAFGARHGVAMGGAPGDGAVPCRNIVVRNSRIANDVTSLHAADIHGWAADCYYVDCDIDGAVGVGGLNCGAPGCRVVNKRTDAPGKAILLTEVVGGTMDFRNIKVWHAPGTLAQNVFGIASDAMFGGGGGGQFQDYHVNLNGINIDCIASLTSIVQHFHNMPGTIKWTLEANDVVLTGDTSGLACILNLGFANTLGHSSAPVRAARISQRGVSYKGTADIFGVVFSAGSWAGTKWDVTPFAGSNANGKFVRNADGTMDCWNDFVAASTAIDVAFLGGYRTGALVWNYPATFLSAVAPYGSPSGGSATGLTSSDSGTTSGTFFLTATGSQTAATRYAKLRARGRWLP